MAHRTIETEDGQVRYRDVRCDACGAALDPEDEHLVDPDGSWRHLQARDSLHVSFDGGYGELIDVFGDADVPRAELCRDCAVALCEQHPWVARLLAPLMNCNVGHVCDGQLVFVPMPDCDADPYRHGWRPVWLVGPVHPARAGQLTAVRAVLDTEADAQAVCRDGEVAQQWLVGNARRFHPEAFPAAD